MKTFQEQFDKLVRAYMNDEVVPSRPCACFIGNLLDGSSSWYIFKGWSMNTPNTFLAEAVAEINEVSDSSYTPKELLQIEGAFMRIWERYGKNEESLFRAFEHALMLLRKLHESKGEVIEDYTFKKRELVNA